MSFSSGFLKFIKNKSKKFKRLFSGKDKDLLKFKNIESEISYYDSLHKNLGLYELLSAFFKNNKKTSKKKIAEKLLKIGKSIYSPKRGREDRYFLARLSMEIDPSVSTLKGYCWSCIHSGYYENATRALAELIYVHGIGEDELKNIKASLASRAKVEDLDGLIKNCYEEKGGVVEESDKGEEYSYLDECYEIYKNGNDGELVSSLYERYKEGGEVEDLKRLLQNFQIHYGIKNTELQSIFIKVGKVFSENNRKDIDVILVEEAMSIEKNTMVMRSAFWTYQKVGDIENSKKCILWLEEFLSVKEDKKLRSFVEKRKKSYLFLERKDILELINKAKEEGVKEYFAIEKKVAYVLHNSLPYASGGYATRGHGLAVAIKNQGFDIEVVSRPGFPLDTKKELKESDIATSEIIDGIKYSRILYPRKDSSSTYEYLIEAANELCKRFLEIKPSFVIAASNHLTAIPALIAARKLGLPFYYEVRGFWEITRISREPEFENTEWYKLLCDLEALTAEESDHIFTLTTPMLKELVRRGVDESKITILPNSCDPEKFEPTTRDTELAKKLNIPPEVPVIGYIGTFVQYEGLDHLAEACGLLKEKNLEFRLLIVGNENTAGSDRGPITQSILDIAKKFQFEDWLIMPGRIPHEEVESYYSLVDIAPFPRKPQPVTEMVSPMKPLEASAMKKAILVSSVQALTDMIVENETGLVFEKGNVDDFSKKLELMIKNKDLCQALGEKARDWVEKERTWNVTSRKIIDFLEIRNG